MTTAEFLSHLGTLDVEVWAEGERLHCSAPEAALTPELSAELKDRKQDILAFLRETNGAAYSAVPSPQPASRNGELPLSFAQQRLWFFDQFKPNSALYNIVAPVRASGCLNVEALQKAFNAMVSRHEVLRTTFAAIDGVPTQVIAAPRPAEFKVIDLTHILAARREEQAYRLLKEESSRPFNLSADLMMRVVLLKLEQEEHILLLVTHHIASDGWSYGVLFRELEALYETFSNGKLLSLPELPIQYGDFAIWQRQWLQGEVLDSQLRYWKKQLADIPAVLELPTDRPRPPVQSYRGARQALLFPKTVIETLEELSRREGVTLFMALLAAFKVLLHCYTGQDDIVVGSPTAGRNRVEIERLIGFFVNNLVLRTDLSGNPSFRELLGRVRQTALEAYAHQDLPFEKLVEELQPKRALEHHPLFQVMFAFLNVPISEAKLPGLTVTPVVLDSGMARFDLVLWMGEDAEGLTGSMESNTVEYNTDLFDAATIARMIGHFQTLLEGIVADPNRRISDFPILTADERHQLLVKWNETQRDYPKDKCFHELFEAQVERTPDAVAVVFDDRQLTYRELNVRANQLAHHLRKLEIGPDTLVGIFLERSLEMVVALLGVLKAGGAYVPLDPTYPSDRLAFMMEDARLSVLLTQPELMENLPPHNARLVCLTEEWTELARESGKNLVGSATATNLAYVIYTSGSTGKPKGVQIEHAALINFLESMRQRPGITSQDTLLAVTTLSFDIAGLELYLPLTVGARVVIVRREVTANGPELSERLSSSGATIMQATPATWRLLLESGWKGNRQLKILCGGEALSRELANQLLDRGASLWNMYGPTESTIWSTVYPVDWSHKAVPVGRPIGNTRIYILDRYLHPVPIGVPGELCIGGAGVARGYINRPELTDEKFIPDAFSEEAGARIYKTGDLARYLPDGNIELLGRIDYQVKVRGYRIELGEIEAVLKEHPTVRDCVVLAREDVPEEKRLVGYVVCSASPSPTTSELRSFLQQKLPDYMIPGAFVFLETLPLTPNRKVDRRALPAPDAARPWLEAFFVAPQSGIEKILAGIWVGVLGLERVGIYDNFFDLGGHSLLLAKVHSQLQAALRRVVPMIELFRYPTISTLAKYLSDAPEQKSLHESSDRAEKQRLAVHNRQRMQAIAGRRRHQG
jgi:amino acid adenylation domain-containing protein